MNWPEVRLAGEEKRHELVLSGSVIAQRITKSGLSPDIFSIVTLNYLNISEAKLAVLPADVGRLQNLQTLVVHTNTLKCLPDALYGLSKLKLLDVAHNEISQIAQDVSKLSQLTSLNLSHNDLEACPSLRQLEKLTVLDVSVNKIKTFPEVPLGLHDLSADGNAIEDIPATIKHLSVLKRLSFSGNKLKLIPKQLASCGKIKELNLKDNPVSDRRLFKLIAQSRNSKQVLDYISAHCTAAPEIVTVDPAANPTSEGAADNAAGCSSDDNSDSESASKNKYTITVTGWKTAPLFVQRTEAVKTVRQYFLGCTVRGFAFTAEKYRRFIQMQTKLHAGDLCQKRAAATIATHDLLKLSKPDRKLVYTVLPRDELTITPLNGHAPISGSALFGKLQQEAEALRKEKKRAGYSGIHKYLHLISEQTHYPCLLAADGIVLSFPPITNSDTTKLSVDSTSLFMEVTSPTSLHVCKKVMNALLLESAKIFESTSLTVGQIRVLDENDQLQVLYPTRKDIEELETEVKFVFEQ